MTKILIRTTSWLRFIGIIPNDALEKDLSARQQILADMRLSWNLLMSVVLIVPQVRIIKYLSD